MSQNDDPSLQADDTDESAATEDLNQTPAVAGGLDDSQPAQGEGESDSY